MQCSPPFVHREVLRSACYVEQDGGPATDGANKRYQSPRALPPKKDWASTVDEYKEACLPTADWSPQASATSNRLMRRLEARQQEGTPPGPATSEYSTEYGVLVRDFFGGDANACSTHQYSVLGAPRQRIFFASLGALLCPWLACPGTNRRPSIGMCVAVFQAPPLVLPNCPCPVWWRLSSGILRSTRIVRLHVCEML